jgi:TonB-dependent starch-binding outer membrane protein SusC
MEKHPVMKLYWFIILTLTLFVVKPASSQTKTMSVNLQNATLQELFMTIERQTGYRFFYNNDEVDISQKISIDATDKSVSEILVHVFREFPYSFRELETGLIIIEALSEKISKLTEPTPTPRVLSGYVTDKLGAPLPGVTVVVKGFIAGTVTNLNGEFSLILPPAAESLQFSYIGMRAQEVSIDGKNYFIIVMAEEAIGISEVVVIGYGTVRKSDLTGSVAVISSEVLTRFASQDISRAIQGRATGVLVAQSGIPGSPAQIRIRGIGSINQTSEPIYVIDGVISSSFASVDPTDIETIQVLKDASAAAIYGADGANGVIIITTRQGEKGKPRISYSGYTSIFRVPRQFEVMNANEYTNFYKRLLTENNIAIPVAYQNHFRQWHFGEGWQQGTSWQDEISRTGFGQNQNLRISGGGEGSNYSVSTNYFNEKGTLLASAAERYSFRANAGFSIGKYIRVGETFNYARFMTQEPSIWEGNPWQVSLITSPLMRMYNPSNKGGFEGPQIPYEYTMPDGSTEFVANTGFNDKVNPRAPLELGNFRSFTNRVLLNFYIEATPVKWLTYKLLPSIESNNIRTKNWLPAFDLGVRSRGQARLYESFQEWINLSLENQITYSNSFERNNITATAVHHVRKSEGNSAEITANGFPYEQLNVISQSFESGRQVQGSYTPFASESWLGRIIYNYDGKYLLTASIRYDGNSRFSPLNRWGKFPSLSAAWKLNQDFLSHIPEISMLKIRFGWGKTGNSNIGNFQYMSLIDGFSQFSPVFGINQNMVPALNVVHNFGNPSIKWEAAEMINLGVDMSLFENRIKFTAEYYIKNQNDLLVKIPISSAYGRVSGIGDPWVNLGEIQNRGLEFNGIYNKMQGALHYTIATNLTTIKNEVKYIPGELLSGNNITTIGFPIGSYFGYKAEKILTAEDFGTNGNYLHAVPATGKPAPGDLKFEDLNNDAQINDLDRTIIGKAIPDLIYSINFDASYKNFDMAIFFYGMYNYQIYNHLRAATEGFSTQDMGHNKLRDYAHNYYREDRPSTKYIRADINNSNLNDRPSSWYLEDGSFLRIKDLQFGYSLPQALVYKTGLIQARFYLSATNLLTITKYSGRDPESPTVSAPLTPGNDNGAYPVPRSFTIGVQVDL